MKSTRIEVNSRQKETYIGNETLRCDFTLSLLLLRRRVDDGKKPVNVEVSVIYALKG